MAVRSGFADYNLVGLGPKTFPVTQSQGISQAAIFAPFFGPNYGGETEGASRDYMYSHEDYPQARSTKGGFLGQFVRGLVSVDNDWLLTLALPLVYTDKIEAGYEEIIFNTPFAPIVPNEAPVRMLTHQYASGKIRATRRGIGIETETEFMTTPEGVQMWIWQMAQIRRVIQHTLTGDAMYAIVNADDDDETSDKWWELKHGYMHASRTARMAKEVKNFAIVNKNPSGLEEWLAEVDQYAGGRGFEPDMLIVQSDFLHFFVYGHPERTWYMYSGERGVTRWLQGPRAVAEIAGIRVYKIPPLDVFSRTAELPNLNSDQITGSFFKARWQDVIKNSDKVFENERAIMVFDQDTGQEKLLKPMDWIKNCARWNEDGTLDVAHAELASQGKYDMFIRKGDDGNLYPCLRFGDMEEHYLPNSMLNKLARSLVKLSPNDIDNIRALVDLYHSMLQADAAPVDDAPADAAPADAGAAGDGAASDGAPRARDSFYTIALRAARRFASRARGAASSLASAVLRTEIEPIPFNTPMWFLSRSPEQIRTDMAAMPSYMVRNNPFMASWYALEVLARCSDQPLMAAYMQSFDKLYTQVLAIVGPTHPLVDPTRCPENLKPYVVRKGLCTFFMRVFGQKQAAMYVMLGPVTVSSVPRDPETSDASGVLHVDTPLKVDERMQMQLNKASETLETVVQTLQNRPQQYALFTKTMKHLSFICEARLRERLYPTATLQKQYAEILMPLYVQRVADFLTTSDSDFTYDMPLNFKMRRITDGEEKSYTDGAIRDRIKVLASDLNAFSVFISPPSGAATVAAAGPSVPSSGESSTLRLLPIYFSVYCSDEWKNKLNMPLVDGDESYIGIFSSAGPVHVPITDKNQAKDELTRLETNISFNDNFGYIRPDMDFSVHAPEVVWTGGSHRPRPLRDYDYDDGGVAAVPYERSLMERDRRRVEAKHYEAFSMLDVPAFYKTTPQLCARFNAITTEVQEAYQGVLLALITMEITQQVFERVFRETHVLLADFLLFKPSVRHLMGGVVVMKGGFETGFTMFGLSSWSQQTNGDLGVTTANSKWWSKAKVINKERVVLGHSMYFKGYRGGNGVRYYTQQEINEWTNGGMMPLGDKPGRASIIVVMIPFTDVIDRNDIDLRGFYDDEDDDGNVEYHYASAEYYRLKHGWNQAPRQQYGYGLKSRVPRPNTVMYQDRQRTFTEQGNFAHVIENTGHFGQYEPDMATKNMRDGQGKGPTRVSIGHVRA